MRISEVDYNLPEELIAQKPAERRDSSRLLVVHRDTGKLEHKHFFDIMCTHHMQKEGKSGKSIE